MFINKYPRGSIFWINDYSKVTGSEQSNTRPAVIISNDMNNAFSPVLTIVPITSAVKTELPVHVTIPTVVGADTGTNTVLCEQIQRVSIEKIGRYIGVLDPNTMRNIEKAILIQLGITQTENTVPTPTPIQNNIEQPGTVIHYSDAYKKQYLQDAANMRNCDVAKKYNITAKAASARTKSWTDYFKNKSK